MVDQAEISKQDPTHARLNELLPDAHYGKLTNEKVCTPQRRAATGSYAAKEKYQKAGSSTHSPLHFFAMTESNIKI